MRIELNVTVVQYSSLWKLQIVYSVQCTAVIRKIQPVWCYNLSQKLKAQPKCRSTAKTDSKKVSLVKSYGQNKARLKYMVISFVLLPPYSPKIAPLGEALSMHLGSSNFFWCLSRYSRMGKHTELNSNPTFSFFAPPPNTHMYAE